MQLRRGPPGTPLPVVRVPALRLIKAPAGLVRAPGGPRAWKPLESYYLRVVAGIPLFFLPLSLLLGFVVSKRGPPNTLRPTKPLTEANDAKTPQPSKTRGVRH